MKTVVITGFAFQGTDELRRHEYLMKPGPPVRTPVVLRWMIGEMETTMPRPTGP